jgi:carbon storage regulator
MLVLSRKIGEKIMIGENIVLTVVKIDRNQIRLGIEAPIDVAVMREEISPDHVLPPEEPMSPMPNRSKPVQRPSRPPFGKPSLRGGIDSK